MKENSFFEKARRADLNGFALFLLFLKFNFTLSIKCMQIVLMAIMIFIHKISLILTVSIYDFIITEG
ncbi:hypothetical protein CON84_24075 [Bacillus sp. AFS094228]|nr:hypothetical protein CON84_24075 [Bacillus sp. AFS094228]